MNRIAQLRQRLADLKAEGTALIDAAERQDGVMTEEASARLDEIQTEVDAVQAQIADAEALAERRRQMDAIATPAARQTRVNDPNPERTHGFRDIGEFARAVHGAVQAQRFGGAVDQRLMAAAPSGTHLGGGDAGEGYSLPPQFRDEVWMLANPFDEFGPLIDEEPTSAREVRLVADETTPWGSGGIKAYWHAEGSKMTASQLADQGRSVPLHPLYALVLASDELLEDVPRLSSRITTKAAQAIAWKKNAAIVDGTGVGQPLGWMKSSALVTVAKESGQTDNTINATNVIKMRSRLKQIPGDRPFWLIGHDALPQLMTMTIGDMPIWVPPSGLADAPGGFLLGLPVRFSDFANAVGQLGDIQLISPRGYYGARRSTGPKFASSIHLYFDHAVDAFRWTFRYGGQPHLSAPVPPHKGASTMSHFVTLAARTS